MTNKKKISLIIIASFLAVILIASCIIWCPKRLAKILPQEKIVSVIIEKERMPGDAQKWQQTEIEQDKIAQFEEKLNSLWYVKRIGIQKDYKMDSPRYVIYYENYTVTFWQYRLVITPNENVKQTQDKTILVLFANSVYAKLQELFLV